MRKKIFFYILSVLVLTGCVPSELDNIQAFEYSFPGLEIIDPLPLVITPVPAQVTETNGSISISNETSLLVQDVVAAVVDDNITEENLSLIEEFSNIAPNVPDNQILDGVDEAWILGVLDGSIQPSPEFLQIQAEFEAIISFDKYFIQLEVPTVDGFRPGDRLIFEKRENNYKGFNTRIESLVVPCKEAAEEIYLQNVKKLEDESAQQIQGIRDFYQVFLSQYELDYNTRIILGSQIIVDKTVEVLEFAIFFNNAIDDLDYPINVKRGLKSYLIAYVLDFVVQLKVFEKSFVLAADFARDKKVAAANLLRNEAIIEAEANLKAALLLQTTNYNSALNNCHNQGAGG